ncbi:MAG: class I SAM-dependent methyltransferase [bacterium]
MMDLKLILTLIALPFLISFGLAGLSAAPWVPTKPKQTRRLIDKLDLRDGMTIYDLGCGSGTVLFAIARHNPHIKLVGYEISLLPYLIACARKLVGGAKYKNVSIKFANLFKQDLSDGDLIFVFLLDKCYPRLIDKLRREIKPNATVVVEAWPLPGIRPSKVDQDDGLLSVFFYKGENFS